MKTAIVPASCVIAVAALASVLTNLGAQDAPKVDAVLALNNAFRKAYADARTQVLENAGPIILVRGDQLVLIDGSRRKEGSVVDRAYHDLKTVAHAPLSVYALLVHRIDKPIDDPYTDRLVSLRQSLVQATNAFRGRLVDDKLEARQRVMLGRCVAFVDKGD